MKPNGFEHPGWCDRDLCSYGREGGAHKSKPWVVADGDDGSVALFLCQPRSSPARVQMARSIGHPGWSSAAADRLGDEFRRAAAHLRGLS